MVKEWQRQREDTVAARDFRAYQQDRGDLRYNRYLRACGKDMRREEAVCVTLVPGRRGPCWNQLASELAMLLAHDDRSHRGQALHRRTDQIERAWTFCESLRVGWLRAIALSPHHGRRFDQHQRFPLTREESPCSMTKMQLRLTRRCRLRSARRGVMPARTSGNGLSPRNNSSCCGQMQTPTAPVSS